MDFFPSFFSPPPPPSQSLLTDDLGGPAWGSAHRRRVGGRGRRRLAPRRRSRPPARALRAFGPCVLPLLRMRVLRGAARAVCAARDWTRGARVVEEHVVPVSVSCGNARSGGADKRSVLKRKF